MDFHRTLKKIKSNLLSLFLAIAVSLTTLPYITEPIPVQAAGASDYADALFVDVIGSHGSGGNSKIVNGISYARTGYLCYMLTETGGNVPGAGAILLKCQGYMQFTVSSGLHSVLERPFSEANGHPFFVKKSLLSVC